MSLIIQSPSRLIIWNPNKRLRLHSPSGLSAPAPELQRTHPTCTFYILYSATGFFFFGGGGGGGGGRGISARPPSTCINPCLQVVHVNKVMPHNPQIYNIYYNSQQSQALCSVVADHAWTILNSIQTLPDSCLLFFFN